MAQVTLKGNPVQLAGTELKVGDKAPDFTLQSTGLDDVTLGSSAGKTRIIATIPSLDTSVCHMETKRFNDEAAKLADVAVLVVSTDLPFGQKRWCGAENVESVQTLSDHRTAEFGKSYGVLIDGGPLDRCLTRAVFVVGADDVVKHVEYCAEIGSHPDYDAVLAAAKA
ncbi:thiol peroxidase [Planctomicrobium sp. SH527]|uniref:thiol peroxidase n=1 Tax=Planctomicrobium sp. SH527 TaxID=3448123 RepID=UPI003F5C0F0E